MSPFTFLCRLQVLTRLSGTEAYGQLNIHRTPIVHTRMTTPDLVVPRMFDFI